MKWVVVVHTNASRITVGPFETLEDAATFMREHRAERGYASVGDYALPLYSVEDWKDDDEPPF